MRKLKKWSCLLLALLMLPALAACGKKQQPDSDASQNEVQGLGQVEVKKWINTSLACGWGAHT